MLLSLDFLYTPAVDVDRAVERCVAGLGAVLEWRVAAMGTVVAAVRMAAAGPLVLFADHLEGEAPIAIYRVADYAAAIARLRERGVLAIREAEIPPGPCATFALGGCSPGRVRADATASRRASRRARVDRLSAAPSLPVRS